MLRTNSIKINKVLRCLKHYKINKIFNSSTLQIRFISDNFQYDILEKYGHVKNINEYKNVHLEILDYSKNNFNIFTKDYSDETPGTIFQTFTNLVHYCIENNTSISDKRFDDFIDSLTDNIKNASGDQLKTIFFLLAKFPEKCMNTRNYAEIWAALDEECIERIKSMTINDKLTYMSLFYNCNLILKSDFCYKCLKKFILGANRKTIMKSLSKSHFIQFMYYFGCMKYTPKDVNVYTLVDNIDQIFYELDTNELAIVLTGLRFNKVNIHRKLLIDKVIDKIIETSDNINDRALTLLIKYISYSSIYIRDLNDEVYRLLDCLQHQVHRLSVTCNANLAFIGAETLTKHERCLSNIGEVVINQIADASILDLSMLASAFGALNSPISACLFAKILEELRKPTREGEIDKYKISFISCVANLGHSQVYPQDLIERVLNRSFLDSAYGKSTNYGQNVLVIHNISKIFYKDLNISNLLYREVNNLYFRFNDYSKFIVQTYNDIVNILKEIRGGQKYVIGKNILTHDNRGCRYVIICDNNEGIPQLVEEHFVDFKCGVIYYPPNNNIWTVLIIIGSRYIIRNTKELIGNVIAKKKQLNKMGYNAAIIRSDFYKNCKDHEEKLEYLNKMINDARTE